MTSKAAANKHFVKVETLMSLGDLMKSFKLLKIQLVIIRCHLRFIYLYLVSITERRPRVIKYD